ncbi:REP element-mobilizing transposase RayT [Mesobacillus stamsii]|uniref:REP element-mobilizing transposase RayT n=1 Tax=Mesobacillus stamsii TaxID=225347 RepID=A0ABU0G220_9BACI|nr:REP element-mobilizing transposase RayT [Mesobacillus stamsii]
MYGKLREDIREIIRKLCDYKRVEIVEGGVSVDHIHLCVKIPPKISVSTFVGYLKGKSALMNLISIQNISRKEIGTFGHEVIMWIRWEEMKK